MAVAVYASSATSVIRPTPERHPSSLSARAAPGHRATARRSRPRLSDRPECKETPRSPECQALRPVWRQARRPSRDSRSMPGNEPTGTRPSPSCTKIAHTRSAGVRTYSAVSARTQGDWRRRRIRVAGKCCGKALVIAIKIAHHSHRTRFSMKQRFVTSMLRACTTLKLFHPAGQALARQFAKSEPAIERPVPGDIAEGRERHALEVFAPCEPSAPARSAPARDPCARAPDRH